MYWNRLARKIRNGQVDPDRALDREQQDERDRQAAEHDQEHESDSDDRSEQHARRIVVHDERHIVARYRGANELRFIG